MKIRSVVLAGVCGLVITLACLFSLAARPGVAQAAPAAQSGSFITVTVKAGDSLAKYSRRFGVTGSALVNANKLKDPNLIFPGQVITIPVVKSFTPSLTTPFYYVVQTGDELFTLGRRFEMDPSIISTANGLQNNVVVLNSTLLIPAGPHSHIAVAGDTLKSIAARYNVLVSLLIRNNPGVSNPDLIFVGQPIFIPILYGAQPVPISGAPVPTVAPTATKTGVPGASATPAPTATTVGAGNFIQVTVHAGESLVTYVARYGVSGGLIRSANPQLKDPNLIFPNQVLIIPVPVSFTPSRTTPFFYVVQAGDSTASIGAKFEMNSTVLAAGNPGASFAGGSTILVPAGPHLYTVKAGDTLGKIATKYGTTPEFLLTGNQLPDPNAIFPGQQIFIPLQINKAPLAFS